MKFSVRILFFLIISGLTWNVSSPAYADLELVKQACVTINSVYIEGNQASKGSGFLVSENGLIVTNAHVIISNDIMVTLKFGDGDREVDAVILYLNDNLDLAVLKVDMDGLKFVEFGNEEELKLGQRVYAFGSPLMFTDIITEGIFSSYNKELGLIQHTADLSHGNSGGPLVTEDGKVVGINRLVVAIEGESRYYFALPGKIVKYVLDNIVVENSRIEIDPAKRLKILSGQNKPQPTFTPPTVDISELAITPDFVQKLIENFSENWKFIESSDGYSLWVPEFYGSYSKAPETPKILACYCYENSVDAYKGAAPSIMIVQNVPKADSYQEFKFGIEKLLQKGFVRMLCEKSAEIPGGDQSYEYEVCKYQGKTDTETEGSGHLLFFIKNPLSEVNPFICIDCSFRTDLSEVYLYNVTSPLIMSIVSTFRFKENTTF